MVKKQANRSAEAFLKLQKMTLKQRIDVIAYDLKNKIDEYASIDPSILAELLGVPVKGENEDNPENWEGWAAYKYVEIRTFECLIKSGYSMKELIDYLEDKVEQDRFNLILSYLNEGKLRLSNYKKVLSQNEVSAIQLANAEIALHNEEFPKLLFTYTIFDSDGLDLTFEALLDEYGGAIQCLKTPYQDRDGSQLNLENNSSKYLYQFLY